MCAKIATPEIIEKLTEGLKDPSKLAGPALRGLMEAMQNAGEDRPKILKAVRTVLDALPLDAQQNIANANMKALLTRITENAEEGAQGKVEELRTELVTLQNELGLITLPTPEAKKELGIWDRIRFKAEAMDKDFWEGDGWRKAGYIASGVGAFLLMRWLWRETFGDSEHDGWIKKAFKWTLAAAATVGGFLGFRALRQWWTGEKDDGSDKNKDPNAPPTVMGPLGAAAGVAQGIAEGGGKIIGDVVNGAAELAGSVRDVWNKFEEGDPLGGFLLGLDRGGTFIWNGSAWILELEGKAIQLPAKWWASLAGFTSPDTPPRGSYDFYILYGAAGVHYVVGRSLLMKMVGGKPPGLLGMLWRSAAWPVVQMRDGASVIRYLWVIKEEGKGAALIPFQRLFGVRHLRQWLALDHIRHGSAKGIEKAIRAWRALKDQQQIIKNNPTVRMLGPYRDPASMQVMEGDLNRLAEKIQEAVRSHEVGPNTPAWLLELKKHDQVRDIGHFAEHMDNIYGEAIGGAEKALALNVQKCLGMLREGKTLRELSATHSIDDITRAVLELDDVARAERLGELLTLPTKPSLTQLLELGATVQDLRGANVAPAALVDAVKQLTGRSVRLSCYAELLASGQDASVLLKSVDPSDLPHLLEYLKGSGIGDDVLQVVSRAASGVPQAVRSTVPLADALGSLPEDWRKAIAPHRSRFTGPATKAFDDAAVRIRNLGLAQNADECAILLSDHSVIEVLSKGGDEVQEALRTAIRVADGDPVRAVRNVARYCMELGPRARGSLLTTEVLTDIARSEPEVAAATARVLTKCPADVVATAKPSVIMRQINAIKAHPYLFGGAIALEIAGLTFDYMEYREMESYNRKAVQSLDEMMSSAVLPDGYAAFRKEVRKDGVTYVHTKNPAVAIDLKHVSESFDQTKNGQILKMAADVGSLGTTMLFPAFAFTLPGGLVLLAAVVTVRGVAEAVQTEKEADLLTMGLPMPLLAQCGFALATKKSEYKWLEDSSNWMVGVPPAQRAELLKRAYTTMFFQEIGAVSNQFPELLSGLLGKEDQFSFLSEKGEFFREHFHRVVQPYLAMRLFQDSNGAKLTWAQAREGAIKSEGDEWWAWLGLYADNVDEPVLRRILREGAWLCAAHLKEIRVHRDRVERARRSEELAQAWRVQGSIDSLEHLRMSARAQIEREELARGKESSSEKLLGLPLKAFGPERYRGAYASQISAILADAYGRFNAELSPSDTRDDATKKNLFSVTLPEGLFPSEHQRTVPLRRLHELTIERGALRPELNQKQRMDFILKEQERIFDLVNPEGKMVMNAFPHEAEYNQLLEYGRMLQGFPEFDPDARVRDAIRALPRAGYTMERFSAVEQMNRVLAELRHQRSVIQSLRYEYLPEELESARNRASVTQVLPNVRSTLVTGSAFGPYSHYDTVASKIITRTQENLLHLSATEVLKPSPDGIFYVREGSSGKYFPQVDGTIYHIPDGDGAQHRVYAFDVTRNAWDWRDARPNERKHGINPRFQREIYVRVPGEKEPRRFEATGSSGEYPIPGGKVNYRDTSRGLEWSVQGDSPETRRFYFFQQNYLGIEQPGQWVEIANIPDLTLRLDPNRNEYLCGHRFTGITVVLRDGAEIQGKVPGKIDALTPFMALKTGTVKDYRGFEFKEGQWRKREKPVQESRVCLKITLNEARRSDIDRIIFTPIGGEIAGLKEVLLVNPNEGGSSKKPGSNDDIAEHRRSGFPVQD